MTRLDKTRVIRPATGTELSARSWLTEAPLRMLMNNLHPDVAERPEELVVYGGIGARRATGRVSTRSSRPFAASKTIRRCSSRAASPWACFAPTRMLRAC